MDLLVLDAFESGALASVPCTLFLGLSSLRALVDIVLNEFHLLSFLLFADCSNSSPRFFLFVEFEYGRLFTEHDVLEQRISFLPGDLRFDRLKHVRLAFEEFAIFDVLFLEALHRKVKCEHATGLVNHCLLLLGTGAD